MTDNPDEKKPAKKKRRRQGTGQVAPRGKDVFQLRIFLERDSAGRKHYHNQTFRGNLRILR
jgi:hypothetical protein